MILLSNGGTNIQKAGAPSDTILVGTVDGVALLAKTERGWVVKHRALQGVFVSALPAHLYVSEDKGASWRELRAFRDAKTVKQWTFPPPPRIGHIKDIVLDGDRLWAGVEIGSLQVSNDFGQSFTELPVDP